jgi:diadenosine tetraphosphate (Ap4A) HIT family hydrolase
MSRWRDPDEWARWVDGEGCGVCARGTPDDAVAVLESGWVGAGEGGPMRGYCFLMLHRHAVELHDLTDAEGDALMRDVRRVSRAVHDLVRPVKMNYEIHGNTVPHLHVHFFPRFVGDPWEGRPIDPRSAPRPAYAPGELAEFRRRLAEALAG